MVRKIRINDGQDWVELADNAGGEWVAIPADGVGGAAGQTSLNSGWWHRAGRIVTVGFRVKVDKKGTLDGPVFFEGLPVLPFSTGVGTVRTFPSTPGGTKVAYINAVLDRMTIWRQDADFSLVWDDVPDGTTFWASATYQAVP
jgi:hypothetical protein